MFGFVDFEIISGPAASQDYRRNQKEGEQAVVCLIFFGRGLRLFRFLCGRFWCRSRRGCGLRFHSLPFAVFFRKGKEVCFRDSVQEIYIFTGLLVINHQKEDILVRGGDGVKFLPVLVGALSTTVPVPFGVKGLAPPVPPGPRFLPGWFRPAVRCSGHRQGL